MSFHNKNNLHCTLCSRNPHIPNALTYFSQNKMVTGDVRHVKLTWLTFLVMWLTSCMAPVAKGPSPITFQHDMHRGWLHGTTQETSQSSNGADSSVSCRHRPEPDVGGEVSMQTSCNADDWMAAWEDKIDLLMPLESSRSHMGPLPSPLPSPNAPALQSLPPLILRSADSDWRLKAYDGGDAREQSRFRQFAQRSIFSDDVRTCREGGIMEEQLRLMKLTPDADVADLTRQETASH